MQKKTKTLKKQIFYITTLCFLLIGVFTIVCYMLLTYWFTSETERDNFVIKIKTAQELPDRFYDIYNLVYENSLNHGQMRYLLNRNNKSTECPCRLAGYDFASTTGLNLISTTFWLEREVSQKECLNYVANNIIFSYKIVGLRDASIHYYDKEIENLIDEEMLELAIIMENTTFYDKKRHPLRLSKRVNDLSAKLKDL